MEKNKNLTDSESVKTGTIIKNALSDTFKKHKKLKKVLIAIAAVFLVIVICLGVLRIEGVQRALFSNFVPETITDERTGITFYREGSQEDVESGLQEKIKVYYYLNNDPSTGKKIYLEDGVYHTGTDEPDIQVALTFALSIFSKLQTIVNVLKWVAVVLVVLVIVLLIVAWYRSFRKRELEERERYRKSHPRH